MANPAARPKVRDQIHPRALKIIDAIERIPEGWKADGTPMFGGLSPAFWNVLQQRPKEYRELLAILNKDFPTYCALLLKVFYKRAGRIAPFIFNSGQVIAWNKISDRLTAGLTLFLIFLKARQLGISTLVAAFQHWQVWRLDDIECSMVGHEKTLVHSFIDRLRTFHEEMPRVPGILRELRAQTVKARVPKDELYYADRRSKISTVVAKNVESRGRSSAHILLSELAFYPDPEGLLQALLPQLPPVGSEARKQCSVIIESTPNGKNFFYDLWQDGKRDETEWLNIFLPWMIQEDEYSLEPPAHWKMTREQKKEQERLTHIRMKIDGKPVTKAQMYWREFTLESDYQGDQDRFDMEFPSDDETCFLIKTRSIFKGEMRYLQACVVGAEKSVAAEWAKRGLKASGNYVRGDMEYTPVASPFERQPNRVRLNEKFVPNKTGNLLIWSPPQVGHYYTIGMDIANGITGRDYSCAHVCDASEGKQVAEYRGYIDPEDFADYCAALGYYYNVALLYPELNNIGATVVKRLIRVLYYPNVGKEEKWDEPGLKDNKYGFYTSDDKKEQIIVLFRKLVKNRHYAISSSLLLSEMSVFVQFEDMSFGAEGGMHDDTVIAAALALYAVRQSPKIAHLLYDKVHDAIPNAVELGLSHAPAFEEIEKRHLPKPILDKLENESYAIPLNPIRGHDDREYGYLDAAV